MATAKQRKQLAQSTTLVPVNPQLPAKQNNASVSWVGGSGVEREHEIEVPDFPSMTTKKFEERMNEAASEFRGLHARAGLQLAAVILPGLEDSKRRFEAGETIDGCKKYGQYVKHLGFTPEQVRQWRHRLSALNNKLPKPTKKKKTEALPAPEPKPETVTTVTPEFVPGEWSQLRYGDPGTGRWDDEYIGKPMDKWANTDGRKIEKTKRLAPGQEKKGVTKKRKMIDAYAVCDEYGCIDVLPTLQEAMNAVRPMSTTDEMLAAADEMATKILSGADDLINTEAVAEEYLAMRRKISDDSANEEHEDTDGRRKPQYEITLCIEASKLGAVERIAKEIFGDALKSVTKVRWGTSRWEELLRAKGHVEEAAEIVSDLYDDIENWKENLPDSFRDSKEEELEQCASQLEGIKDGLDAVSGWDDVEFPGRY